MCCVRHWGVCSTEGRGGALWRVLGLVVGSSAVGVPVWGSRVFWGGSVARWGIFSCGWGLLHLLVLVLVLRDECGRPRGAPGWFVG